MKTRARFARILPAAAALAVALSPAFAQAESAASLPLGAVSVLPGSEGCTTPACYELSIVTPQTQAPTTVRLKIGEPPVLPSRGTILFMTGGKGQGYWESFGKDARRVLSELQAAGYRTVQVKWLQSWLIGAPGQLEGQQQLASRSATLSRWVFDTIHDPTPGTAFCATGNSSGAAQIAYMLVDYGFSDLLSAVVLTSGPPFSRIDLGCLHASRASQPYWYPKSGRALVDEGFGFMKPGSGPCARGDASFTGRFLSAGLAPGHGLYLYPKTMTWFLFGDEDNSGSVPQGLLYFNEIAKTGTPLVGIEVLAGTPHAVPSTRRGADRVRDLLLLDCHPR